MRFLSLFLLALLFVAAACDSDNGSTMPDDFTGSYDATVTGAISQTHSGNAFFGAGSNTGTGAVGFAISLGQAAQPGAQPTISILGERDRPGTGTYSIVAPGAGGAIGATYFAGGTQVYLSTSGTLTISRSDDDRLDGTFEFSGTSVANGGQVTVSGSFRAGGATVNQ